MEGVLTEVLELFPSEFIHIGGDEAEVLEMLVERGACVERGWGGCCQWMCG